MKDEEIINCAERSQKVFTLFHNPLILPLLGKRTKLNFLPVSLHLRVSYIGWKGSREEAKWHDLFQFLVLGLWVPKSY